MSVEIYSGGYAFPSDAWDNCAEPGCMAGPMRGMSLRQWYAGMALQGLAANSRLIEGLINSSTPQKEAFDSIASDALGIADAMIFQLEKK